MFFPWKEFDLMFEASPENNIFLGISLCQAGLCAISRFRFNKTYSCHCLLYCVLIVPELKNKPTTTS